MLASRLVLAGERNCVRLGAEGKFSFAIYIKGNKRRKEKREKEGKSATSAPTLRVEKTHKRRL
jgi:hypothetical protein